MLFSFLLLGSLSASASLVSAGPLVINTPDNVVSGQPTLLTWSGGQAPFFLAVTPGNDPFGPPLEDLGEQEGTSFVWVANVAPGTSISFELKDSTGAIALTAPETVQ